MEERTEENITYTADPGEKITKIIFADRPSLTFEICNLKKWIRVIQLQILFLGVLFLMHFTKKP